MISRIAEIAYLTDDGISKIWEHIDQDLILKATAKSDPILFKRLLSSLDRYGQDCFKLAATNLKQDHEEQLKLQQSLVSRVNDLIFEGIIDDLSRGYRN